MYNMTYTQLQLHTFVYRAIMNIPDLTDYFIHYLLLVLSCDSHLKSK